MAKPVAVFCKDPSSLRTLKTVLARLGIAQVVCRTRHEAMELALAGECFALVVDFDLPGASEVARMAALLPQKALLFSMTGRWLGSGRAFQSGAHRILYKPLETAQVNDAFEESWRAFQKNADKQLRGAGRQIAGEQSGRRKKKSKETRTQKTRTKQDRVSHEASQKDRRQSPRLEVKTLVYLEFPGGTLPAIGVNFSEHGFAVHATEAVPLCGNVPFRCVLPGAAHTLRGHAELTWADHEGRAGLFFSRLAAEERKHLKQWLRQLSKAKYQPSVRSLLPAAKAVFAGA